MLAVDFRLQHSFRLDDFVFVKHDFPTVRFIKGTSNRITFIICQSVDVYVASEIHCKGMHDIKHFTGPFLMIFSVNCFRRETRSASTVLFSLGICTYK